jgi:hypothetical protein
VVAAAGSFAAISTLQLPRGPAFPAIFLGAAGGVALSHLPGLPLVSGVAMGMGAMTAVPAPDGRRAHPWWVICRAGRRPQHGYEPGRRHA